MAGTIEWINYQGHEILFNNRSNLRNQEIIQNVGNAVKMIKGSGKKDILYLIDNTNTIISPDVKDVIKKAGHELKPYLKKSAVIGPNAAQKILINILSKLTGMNIKIHDSLEEAKEWLIK